MATTTAVLSGFTINEIHSNPLSPDDFNGTGTTTGADEYFELFNTSGAPVDISGWQLYEGLTLVRTFAPGTIIPAGGYITVVDSADGTSNAISNATGLAVYSDASFTFAGNDAYGLLDPDNDTHIHVNGSTATTSSNQLINEMTLLGATQVGPIESFPAPNTGDSAQRVTDGDATWTTGAVSPGEANCFLAGTMIDTQEGPRAIETLRPGDLIRTADGRATPLLWLGQQRLRRARLGERMQPVCIRAGALGGGLPQNYLYVTADHGMALGGYLINAAALVNGAGVAFVPLAELPDRFTVYHIETQAHEVILANGAPAETLIDVAGRKAFDNYGEYLDLYGVERVIPAQAPAPHHRSAAPAAGHPAAA
jgi:hypothetical protein